MKILQSTERRLSPKASELVQFDMDSIRQVASAKDRQMPDIWLVDPDQYEKDGRVLRDSPSPRLLGYSPGSRMLYVTDGCNACSHELAVDLSTLDPGQLRDIAERNKVRQELVEQLVSECRV